jgi:hypothetical protein
VQALFIRRAAAKAGHVRGVGFLEALFGHVSCPKVPASKAQRPMFRINADVFTDFGLLTMDFGHFEAVPSI